MQIFGLDLSDAWIRLALLSRRRSGLALPMRGEIAVPAGAIVDGEIQNPQVVTDVLRQLIQATGLRTHRAFVSLPERHTFIKAISIPADDSVALAQRVKEEALQHLPFAWEDMYFDFFLMPEALPDKRRAVIIGASSRALVDTYVKTLAAAGIEPVGLEIESLAIARATLQPNEDLPAAIVLDLGRTRSTLILVEHGALQFSATIRYAGKELNQYIRDELKITDEQAERAKRIFGLDEGRGKGVLRKVLMPQVAVLAAKVEEVEAYYHEHFPNPQPISKVFLTGSGALLRGIDRELSQAIHLPVELRPAWIMPSLLQADPKLNPDVGFTYATAFGLSLLNFNPSR